MRARSAPRRRRSARGSLRRACSAGSQSTSSSCATAPTHPFLTLQFLTDGEYDAATALFVAPSGREKHLVATDHLEDDRLRGFSIDDLFDVVVRHRLHFDPARQSGVVFHMMGALSELGSVGLTAVGDSREQADALFRRAERVVHEEAAVAPELPLPPV
jgi:hypothetical protein